MILLLALFLGPILWFLYRAIVVLKETSNRRRTSLKDRPLRQDGDGPIKTLAVLGSGGHTTEMLQLLKTVDSKAYSPLIFVVAESDTTSERRVEAFEGGRKPDQTFRIPRSREVGQSYISSIGTTLYAFFFCMKLVWDVKPDLLLCNGPGTCLPIAIATLFYRILGVCEGNLVFIESFCRVESLSLTGKLLYPLADLFIVHWDELHQKFPKSCTISTFVPNKSKES
uniref:UDP-N-acetylglucosamine transferase subunit ALG14 n=1 Tax=Grammatophora oceanica TaxID=210454 RepID=A0A7S1Y892_9STRA|mmetsp:Transcript_31496/g.46737  ORF Transcript_31496/g.46737 Transcript_31496/m.46737 type:complete len:226 (+) Transcript_31496:57-734(+)